MATLKAHMQKLIEQRDQLIKEMEAIKNKIAGFELAIQLLESDGKSPEIPEAQGRRSNVKTAILDLLKEVGTTGLNAQTAVEIAARRGINLDRGSVSSLLSRLKKDNVIEYDKDRYRLPQFGSHFQRPSPDRSNAFN
jgi:hypothetical protein